MAIDIHAHLYPEDYLHLLAGAGVQIAGHAGLGASDSEPDLDRRLALMDEAGVELQVVSSAPLCGYLDDARQSERAARMINDRSAQLVAAYPDRFRAFATVPLPHVDRALVELGRALDDLQMAGVVLTTTILGSALTDERFAPLWAELDRRAAMVFLHPSGDCAGSPQIDGSLRWLVGAPVEDTVAAAKLIVSDHLTRYSKVRIINSHFGGALPMLLERWDNLARLGGQPPAIAPSSAARLMWYDTVCHGSATALAAGLSAVGYERLLLGSDFPYQSGDMYVRGAVGFIGQSLDDAETANAILDANARHLLGLS